jgi:2,3-bisphosphoglycerate-independent phosphoglycerate mutase
MSQSPAHQPAAPTRPVLIIVRDGWGKNPSHQWDKSNAALLAKHPTADHLAATYPTTLIKTSGFDVGLPEGTMGNSEVGHQNIGAGRIVDQESVKITKEILSGEFYSNPVLVAAVTAAVTAKKAVHLLGIVSDAGVHGLLEHLYAMLELCKRQGATRVYLHAFTDGRDTSPNSGLAYLRQVEAKMTELGVGQLATVSGRYYAMDRDNRWDRVEKAYAALRHGTGPVFSSAAAAVQSYYDHPTSSNMTGDEFITPCVISDDGKTPRATIADGDTIIFYNYRGDRPREITKAFVLDPFDGFDRGPKPAVHFVTLTAYEQGLPVEVAYPKPPKMVNTLGQYLSGLGKTQFRCAETEKFPHVTFFFNDYREEPWPGEDRQMCPSPKHVKTYDQAPEMAAACITEHTVKAIESKKYDLLVVNFANCDMVGHTGVLAAAVKAVEFVDACCGQLLAAAAKAGVSAIVTADHGNCEQMVDPDTGGPHTAHTTYDVELFVVDDRFKGKQLRTGGRLADVAPTALHLMGLPKPPEMTGQSLIPA